MITAISYPQPIAPSADNKHKSTRTPTTASQPPLSSVVETPPPHLFLVLVDVKVQLTERAQCVELVAMETGLFHQVGVHVLITDAGHFGDIPVVPEGKIHSFNVI